MNNHIAAERPPLDFAQLIEILNLNSREQQKVIAERVPEIDAIIATQAMGAVRYHNMWVLPAGQHAETPLGAVPRLGFIESMGCLSNPLDYYRPCQRADQALQAMDAMIARGWVFHPKFGGLDYSLVDVTCYERALFAQALIWGDRPERHALAISVAVALACLTGGRCGGP